MNLKDLHSDALISMRTLSTMEAIGVTTLTQLLQNPGLCVAARNYSESIYYRELDRLVDWGIVTFVSLSHVAQLAKGSI